MKRSFFFIAILLVTLFFPSGASSQTTMAPATLKFPDGVNRVEIPFTRYRGWIILKMKVNDSRELSFILDTGAPVGVLSSKSTADSLNLNIIGQAKVAGGDGKEPKTAPLAAGIKYTLPSGIEIENGLAVVGAAGEIIHGVDGIIGKYIFDGAVVNISWEKNILTLIRNDDFTPEKESVAIPIEMTASGHIYTDLNIEIDGTKIETKGIIDTGNRSGFSINKNGILPEKFPESEKKISGIIVSWGANGSTTGDVSRTKVQLSEFGLDSVVTIISSVSGDMLVNQGFAANIGISILEKFNLTFDYKSKKLYLKKNDSFDHPFLYNRSGILLLPKRNIDDVTVIDIIPCSPAAEGKLKVNDRIVSVNSKKVSDIKTDDLDDILSGKNVEEIELQIKRGKKTITKKIRMRSLI